MNICEKKVFDSKIVIPGQFKSDYTQDEIKNEEMFFNSSLDFAYENGGEITKGFIDALPSGWEDGVIDTRVHMLMPGWYPAIPGFHHDDVPRPNIPVGTHFINAGQPDYENPRYFAEHIMGLVNAEICPTIFALGKAPMPAIKEGQLIYRKWHKVVEKLLSQGKLEEYKARSGDLIEFDWQAFHSCSKALGSGWRWFARISRNTDRQKTITNEIRRQVQTYLEFPMEGW